MDNKKTSDKYPHILLINLHSSKNAGDAALTLEAIRQLKEQFRHASIVLAMNDPSSYHGQEKTTISFTSWIKPAKDIHASSSRLWIALPKMLISSALSLISYRVTGHPRYLGLPPEQKDLLTAYFEADMIISSAGNYLYTSGKVGYPLLLSLYSILYGWLVRKPLYTLPLTLGPFYRKREMLLTKKVFAKIRLIMLRDTISLDVLRGWNISTSRWQLLPDLAFAFNTQRNREDAIKLLQKYGVQKGNRPYLGVTLIHWGAQNRKFSHQIRYETAIAAAIRAFLTSYEGQVIIFSQVQGPTPSDDDRIPAKRIMAQLKDMKDKVVLIDQWVPPYILKATYGMMDLFLGTRLHSNIFALAEGVPVVAIGYQYKTKGTLKMMDLEQWAIDIEMVTEETLIKAIHKAWAERERTRSHIKNILPDIQKQASRAGALIASDFLSLGTENKS